MDIFLLCKYTSLSSMHGENDLSYHSSRHYKNKSIPLSMILTELLDNRTTMITYTSCKQWKLIICVFYSHKCRIKTAIKAVLVTSCEDCTTRHPDIYVFRLNRLSESWNRGVTVLNASIPTESYLGVTLLVALDCEAVGFLFIIAA